MSLATRNATDADRDRWDAFVAARPEADVLQAWAWGETWAPEGEEPVRILVEDRTGGIRAVGQLLVRPSSAGRTMAYVPHGPVWDRGAPDADATLAAILAGIAAAARDRRAIVVKLDPRTDPAAPLTELRDPTGRIELTRARRDLQAPTSRIVDLLDGGPALAAAWDADVRRKVGRASRERVVTTVDRVGDRVAIEAFAGLLAETSERGGFHARTEPFLERLANGLSAEGGWFLTLATRDDAPIAGVVTPRIGDRAFYLYGASRRDHELRHAYGSDAAMAASMVALARDGTRTIDMWGVTETDDPTADPAWAGFSLFKRRFGGRPIRHPGTYDLVLDRALYAIRDARERVIDVLGIRP